MELNLKDVNKYFKTFLDEIKLDSQSKKNIEKAYNFAKKAHAFQRRKSGEPYIMHPVEVCKIVHSFGLDEASLVAALLHDVVEDTPITIEEIKADFGEEVSILVNGLSKITHFDEKKKYEGNEYKNIETLRKILLASAKDIRILIIKLSDRLHNMRTLGDLNEDKKIRISNETMQIYVPIAQKIGIYSIKWELEDLSFKYLDSEMFQFIKEKVGLKRVQREEIVKIGVEEIKEKLEINKNNFVALGRPKNFYSIYKKIKDKAKNFEDIFDLYAVRIICKTKADCYILLGMIHERFKVFPDKLKDYIATPKANGYESIHTVVYLPSIKGPVEIQIRTEDMNKLAEFGIAAHWKYKNLKEDKNFDLKISWLREVLQWEKEHQDNHEFLKLLKFDFFENEIFVFTPKNDIITLPENSTVLDFAYAIHTDIGDRTQKAKVNGSISNIDKKLKSGDIIEIITNKTVRPTAKWLKIVNTSKARIKIKSNLDLKELNKNQENVVEFSLDELKSKIYRIDTYKNVRFAGCCTISYGEQIVGILNKDKKLLIHSAACPNAKYSLNKKIPLRWDEEKDKEINLEILFKDRYGIIMDILNVFEEYNINCTKLNTKVAKDGIVTMSITILDGKYIKDMKNKLKELDSLIKIREIKGIFDSLKK